MYKQNTVRRSWQLLYVRSMNSSATFLHIALPYVQYNCAVVLIHSDDSLNWIPGIVTRLFAIRHSHYCGLQWQYQCILCWTQVKEVGLSVQDCSCLAQDAFRIFGVYWSLSGANNGSLPPYWPNRLSALSSSQNPLNLKFNGVPTQVYLSVSPVLRSIVSRVVFFLWNFLFIKLNCYVVTKADTDIFHT